MGDRDKWRHVRAVLSKRTPDSILVVNRYGMGINPHATGKAVTVLMRKHDDPNREQVDADLDALSVLWNTADELLADADALAGAWAEIGRLRAALATIQQWDCLNPPNTGLCEDLPWLRELVDTALGTEGSSR